MRKINGQPVEAHTDISSLRGGEALKWDERNSKMAWELQDSTSNVIYKWYGDRGVFGGGQASNGQNIDYISIASGTNSTYFGDLV